MPCNLDPFPNSERGRRPVKNINSSVAILQEISLVRQGSGDDALETKQIGFIPAGCLIQELTDCNRRRICGLSYAGFYGRPDHQTRHERAEDCTKRLQTLPSV